MSRLNQSQRRDISTNSSTQQVSEPYTFPAPVGGLNAKDAIAAMPETDAQILDNLFPQPSWVEIRGGRRILASFTGNCETLMAYSGILSTPKQMFAAVANVAAHNIYRVDNLGGGAVGAPVVTGLTSTAFDYTQFGTGAGQFLILVNGADSPYVYDGTNWQAYTTSSTPYALTGGPSPLSQLSQVVAYKQRLWFLQAGTMNVYYLPQNVVGGALTLINMGPNFMMGGSIAAMISISVDNSAGTNDYMAFISTEGEIVQFQGYDPASITTWSLQARYYAGAPVTTGRNCWQKLGMDAAIISQDGLALLSELMLTDRSQNKLTLSDKVRYAINAAIGLNGTFLGWQVKLFPAGNKLLLNVPTNSARTASYTFVMNTLTGSWCTWGLLASSFNALCYEVLNNNLYFGGVGSVEECDTGTDDDGAAIAWTCFTAFNYFGDRTAYKRFTMAKPYFQTQGSLSIAIQMNADFSVAPPKGTIPVSVSAAAVWNVSLWNNTFWADAQQVVAPWIGLQGDGFCGALYLRAATSGVTAKWMATTVISEPGGNFYAK